MAESNNHVDVIPIDGGVRLRLRVKAGGRSDRIVGAHDGALKVEVGAAPERGKANDAVVSLVATSLGLRKRHIDITAGHTSRDKTVAIRGIGVGDVVGALARIGVVGQKR